MKKTIIYMRVSTQQQSTASQEADLTAWMAKENLNGQADIYIESQSGATMNRPQWEEVMSAVHRGEVERIVVWRLDRLGRTATGLCKVFDELQKHGVVLVSLKDGIDLGTPAGRLMAHVLASVAAYEREVIGERIRAGIKASTKKRHNPKRRMNKIKPETLKLLLEMRADGYQNTRIGPALGIAPATVSIIMKKCKEGHYNDWFSMPPYRHIYKRRLAERWHARFPDEEAPSY